MSQILKNHNLKWTDQDIATLQAYHKEKSVKALSTILGRTPAAVQAKLWELRLSYTTKSKSQSAKAVVVQPKTEIKQANKMIHEVHVYFHFGAK